MHGKIVLQIPLKTVSESNLCTHWSQKHKRNKNHKILLRLALSNMSQQVQMPCKIKLVRISPRSLDDDNLRGALKHIRDYIADFLIPGLAMGRADADQRLQWEYDQEKGSPQSIRIEIMHLEAA